MSIIKTSKIDWQKTLMGMKVDEEIKKTNLTPSQTPLVRSWASYLKKRKGVRFKVSLKANKLTILRIA